jgi:hypothetical protein
MNVTRNRRNEISNSLEDTYNTSRDMLEGAYNTSRDMVADNPLTSTLVAFGTGLAIGVLIGHSLGGGRHAVEATTMERLGRQVCDVLRSSLPDSIGRHIRV